METSENINTDGNDMRSAESAFFDVYFINASESIFITDPKGHLVAANPSYAAMTGTDVSTSIGKLPSVFKSDLHNENFYQKLWRTLKRKGSWKGEILNERGDGNIRREWLSISSHKDQTGETAFYVCTLIDAANQMFQALNKHYYDSLTKLPNRLLLQDRLEFMINHARRNNELMALLLIDIDRFKLVNDNLGYEAGDTMLRATAERLLACVRDVDAVFRSGDDEFAVILEEIVHPEDAAKVAKRALELCAETLMIEGQDIHPSVSIGISIFPTDGDNKVQILQNAETAMLRAREIRLSNYQHYKHGMNEQAHERLTIENDLRNALSRGELCTFFQPQVAIDTFAIKGAEALIRWNHPELGMLPPTRFIPIAEDSGLILSIGEWVLRSSCMQARIWQDAGLKFTVSVNLSANQFQQENLVSIVESALKDSGIDPKFLELEITETMSMKNPEETLKTLRRLKDLGVKIAIDDFGTGYSSLSYLKQFPIDTLKIDRSFLIDITDNPRDSEIVKAIVAMAHSLSLSVIAEGVEEELQAKHLLEIGCEMMQGYLFSPPVPVAEFERLLQKQGEALLS